MCSRAVHLTHRVHYVNTSPHSRQRSELHCRTAAILVPRSTLRFVCHRSLLDLAPSTPHRRARPAVARHSSELGRTQDVAHSSAWWASQPQRGAHAPHVRGYQQDMQLRRRGCSLALHSFRVYRHEAPRADRETPCECSSSTLSR